MVRVTAKPLNRPRPEGKKDRGGNHSGNVGINNRSKSLFKTRRDSRPDSLAKSQFFANPLKDEHVRVHTHTNGQNDSRDARQGKNCANIPHRSDKNEQIQRQRHIGVDSRAAIIDQHKAHHCE